MVKKIKHNIVYNLFIMLDKIKDYDKNENFSNYSIDPELQKFLLKEETKDNHHKDNSDYKSLQNSSLKPDDEMLRKGMKDLYSNRIYNII